MNAIYCAEIAEALDDGYQHGTDVALMTGRDAALGETDVLPLVGIGMPVYNGMRYVAEAIDSILRQSYESFELVICDNASTDGTADLCRKFAASDPRIRYFRNDTNIGAHPNYNRTFELTRGKYFKWAPHDDVLHHDFLSACVEALEADPGVVICQTLLDYIDDQGTQARHCFHCACRHGIGLCSRALCRSYPAAAQLLFGHGTLSPRCAGGLDVAPEFSWRGSRTDRATGAARPLPRDPPAIAPGPRPRRALHAGAGPACGPRRVARHAPQG